MKKLLIILLPILVFLISCGQASPEDIVCKEYFDQVESTMVNFQDGVKLALYSPSYQLMDRIENLQTIKNRGAVIGLDKCEHESYDTMIEYQSTVINALLTYTIDPEKSKSMVTNAISIMDKFENQLLEEGYVPKGVTPTGGRQENY